MISHRLEIPVELLLRLYHVAPEALRADIDAHIATYKKEVHHKGHVAEGFRKIGQDLVFDEQLYLEAVYRGKVQTYGESAREHMKQLKRAFESLQAVATEQQALAAQIPADSLEQRVGLGLPISAVDQKLLARLQPLLGSADEA